MISTADYKLSHYFFILRAGMHLKDLPGSMSVTQVIEEKERTDKNFEGVKTLLLR